MPKMRQTAIFRFWVKKIVYFENGFNYFVFARKICGNILKVGFKIWEKL